MTETETMVGRLALIFANHADGFMAKGDPPSDAGFSWGEYSARERHLAIAAAHAILDALMNPTKPMLFAGMDAMARDDLEPTEEEFRAGFVAAMRAAKGELVGR